MADETQHVKPAPLEGITVLDLTQALAGPFCTMQLGDMGAEILKIERPGRGDDSRHWGPPFIDSECAYFISTNRNKKSVTLNLKADKGKEVLTKLIEKCDVLIENFKPGSLDRLGFGYDKAKEINPRIVYCSISGYGQNGPQKYEAAYDLIIQGESGLMSITGFPENPPTKVGTSISDMVASFYALQSILMALMVREKTDKGQYIDISILDSVVSLLTYRAGFYFANGKIPERKGNEHPSLVPYEVFEAKDGYLTIGVANDYQFRKLCQVIGREDLADDPRYAQNKFREKNRVELKGILCPIIAGNTKQYWLEKMKPEGIPCGAINNIKEVVELEQMKVRNMVVDIPHPTVGSVRVLGNPMKLSETPGRIKTHPPVLGEHTEEVLHGLGYSTEEIRAMRDEGVL